MPLDATTRRLLGATSLYHKAQRRRYEATAVKRELAARRSRFYRDVWDEAAAAVGATVTPIDAATLEIRCGEVVLRTRSSLTSLDDELTVSVAENKPLVYRLLTERGIRVPRHAVCDSSDLSSAWRFARSLGRGCVVKPAHDTSGAVGVATGISTKLEMARALAYAGAFCDQVVIEDHVPGDVYRMLYLDGELLDVVLRRPPWVQGDGVSDVATLIAGENERRLRVGIEASQSLIKVGPEVKRMLAQQGHTLRSVPRPGRRVVVSAIVNDNRREDNESAAAALCPAVVAAGADAAAAVGARLAGVDVIMSDPSLPLGDSGGAVIEVNTAPGYYYHYMKADGRTPVATMILTRLVQGTP